MKQAISKIVTVSAVVLALGLAGCASTSDLKKLRKRVDQVEATANQASDRADSAMSSAADANARAAEATGMAEEANACCVSTNEKIGRMFEESQRK
jgi:methyl-accepting chemotaxis protein